MGKFCVCAAFWLSINSSIPLVNNLIGVQMKSSTRVLIDTVYVGEVTFSQQIQNSHKPGRLFSLQNLINPGLNSEFMVLNPPQQSCEI